MEYSTSYQNYEKGELTGYVFKTYVQDRELNGTKVVDILITRLDKYESRSCFIKQSGKFVDLHEKISLSLPKLKQRKSA